MARREDCRRAFIPLVLGYTSSNYVMCLEFIITTQHANSDGMSGLVWKRGWGCLIVQRLFHPRGSIHAHILNRVVSWSVSDQAVGQSSYLPIVIIDGGL